MQVIDGYNIYKDTDDYVILKKTDDKLLAMELDLPKATYIRITKGESHVLSMYDEEMNKCGVSINWGNGSSTLISRDFTQYRNGLVNGLYTKHGVVIERNYSGTPILMGGFGIDGKFVAFR